MFKQKILSEFEAWKNADGKKKALLVILAFILSLCSCVSVNMHPTAYVENTEDFVASDITRKAFSNAILWEDYELRLKKENKKETQTVFGVNGEISQEGDFFKNGEKLFSVKFLDSYTGWRTKSLSKLEHDYKMLVNSIDIYKMSEIKTEDVDSCIDEEGKVTKMLFNATMGEKIIVNDELYAVIDFYRNPAGIRINPAIEMDDKNRDFMSAAILCIYYFGTH